MNRVTLVTPFLWRPAAKSAHDRQQRRARHEHAKDRIAARVGGCARAASLLVKEKALTRARDALAAERRRMPWMAVEKAYMFDGPEGKASLLDLFAGRRQLIVYRAFFRRSAASRSGCSAR
jgi:predicted dithiol-disulfide oxidoreductase (DUF899 family)